MTSAAAGARAPWSGRRVLELAALGVAAVPEIDPVSVVATRPTRDGVDTAVLRGRDSRDWVVAAPTAGAAGAELEAEVAVLRLLANRMPFATPDPRGLAAMRGGGRALVYEALRGMPVSLPALSADTALADSVGRSIGAIHALDPEEFTAAGLVVHDSQTLRRRCLATLDRGAEPGVVPAGLLSRWESSIENVSMWQFEPRPVHGELVSDRVLVEGSGVTGILDWAGARVSDPAEDLAWIAVGADADGLARVLGAYRAVRPQVDVHLLDRAVLHGEMALVSWLMHGLRVADERIVTDATSMLQELADWHDEHSAPAVAGTLSDAPEPDAPDPDASDAGDVEEQVPAERSEAHRGATRPDPFGVVVDLTPAGTANLPGGTPDPNVIDSSTNTVPRRSAMGVSSVARYSAARYGETEADDTDVIDLIQVRAYLTARSGGSVSVVTDAATNGPAEPEAAGQSSVTLPAAEPSRTS